MTPPPVWGHAPLLTTAGRALPASLRGVTVDTTDRLSAMIASVRALRAAPTVRLVLDPGTTPGTYAPALGRLRGAAWVMAELVDSEAMADISAAEAAQRARMFGAAFRDSVDLWEIGNEVNGAWVGRSQAEIDAKVGAMFDVIHGELGKPTALTLNYWAGPQCYGQPWEATLTYARAMPERVRLGVDTVLLSLYETACDPVQRPTARQLVAMFRQLAVIFPNAKLGIGEIGAQGVVDGLPKEPDLAEKQRIARRYYGMDAGLRRALGARWAGGYFWWYYMRDAVPMGRKDTLWPTLDELLASME
ncbi:Tat pathway signal sequence [Novosphingobium fuchskuhlense]|uniref:Tat pathway signal sequence n=1 Tax=Novosphingobium fuchskuhlense TaxID=1117702 RepID=UPI0012E3CBDE|nr:Tat pathway signal sequence [Novosphingobium fuchskuhlense]